MRIIKDIAILQYSEGYIIPDTTIRAKHPLAKVLIEGKVYLYETDVSANIHRALILDGIELDGNITTASNCGTNVIITLSDNLSKLTVAAKGLSVMVYTRIDSKDNPIETEVQDKAEPESLVFIAETKIPNIIEISLTSKSFTYKYTIPRPERLPYLGYMKHKETIYREDDKDFNWYWTDHNWTLTNDGTLIAQHPDYRTVTYNPTDDGRIDINYEIGPIGFSN